ncbi:MAG: PAS domain S-box protein [Sphingobacteriales bacterium]|nr:MAG: PAS domain S-box protein [Sphingobacteriales bacterium]
MMEQVLDFFRKLFDTSDWPPRWHCGNWSDFHGWLYIISDLLIWSAYFAIPLTILRYVTRRVDVRFTRAYFLFAAFILACGSTHLLDAVIFWFPAYRLSALVRFFTGVISWVTVFYLLKLVPIALRYKSAEELEREVQERQRVEEELRVAVAQLNEAQEIAKMGHWQWDIARNEVTWSLGLFRVYGLEPTEKGLNYEQYLAHIHPEDRNFVDELIRQALQDKHYQSFTHRVITPAGETRMLLAKGDVLLNEHGNLTGMIGTAQDITDQYEAQHTLLENTARLEATNAELRKFAYVASHDLQEPLRKIRTFISLMQKERDAITPKGAPYFDKIDTAAARMQVLIEDILRFSNLQMSDSEFVPVDLGEVLRFVLQDMEVSIAETRARVDAGVLPVIEGIPSQLGQLLLNLLRNAIKFSRPGVPPVVTLRARTISAPQLPERFRNTLLREGSLPANLRAQRWIELTVTDNGLGFDPQYAEKIFEIFQRLHAAQAYHGTGIGLAIVRKIVDNHKGFIQAEGAPGEGATFSIWLPERQVGSL